MRSRPDFSLENHGSIVLMRPNTAAARRWLEATSPDDAQFFGRAMAIEPRYVAGAVAAALADGLNVRPCAFTIGDERLSFNSIRAL